MCWVVDASGVRFRKKFFENGLFRQDAQFKVFYYIDNPSQALPLQWIHRNSFIFLDFKGLTDEMQYESLLCLVPTSVKTKSTLAIKFSRIDFVERTKNNELPSFLISLRDGLNRTLQAQKK